MFGMIFSLPFLMVGVVFVLILVKLIGQWNQNNHSPRLTVPAVVVAKRGHTTHHHDAGEIHHSHSSTTYYATFQFESGDRLELHVPSSQFGYLVEGDRGQLSFQGARFLGFERT
ncbi:MAG: DUF2500 domain-containing protein [Oscillospiraceae bacterium]|nr:DUF2500 domain-containing protein [Oscillospiraceae bacterium]